MALLQHLLHLTNFRNPILQTLVPSVSAAFAIQAAFAIPSVIAQSERFYDFSGSVTVLAVTALSLYLPSIRARYATGLASKLPLPSLLGPFLNAGGKAGFNWRQVALSAAATIWTLRLGSYLFQRVLREGKDSRFDEMKKKPVPFFAAWMVQATWVSTILLPVILVNAVPATAFAALPALKLTDALGLGLYVGGILFEAAADRQKSQWLQQKRAKQHDEEFITKGLWSRCRYPNYFGEATLWTGVATAAAGVLVTSPIRLALGLGSPLPGLAMAYLSPTLTAFLLLKVSGVPLSEPKYDKRYGDRKDYQEWKKNTPLFFPKIF